MDYPDYSAPPPSYESLGSLQQRPSSSYTQAGGSSSSVYPSSSSSTASYIAATTIASSSSSSAFTPNGYPNEKAQRVPKEPERDIQECIRTLEAIAADSGRASQTTPASQLASPNSILSSLGYEPSEGSWYEVIQQFEHVVGICYDYHVLGYGTLSITEPGLVWEGNIIQPKDSYGDFLEQDLRTFRFRFPSKLGGGGHVSAPAMGSTSLSSSFCNSTSTFSTTTTTTTTTATTTTSLSPLLGYSCGSLSMSLGNTTLGRPERTRRIQASTIKQVMPVVQSGAVAMARADKAFKSRLEWGGGGVLDDAEYDYPGVMLITTVLEDTFANDPDAVASFQFVFERAKMADLEKAAKDIREHLPSSSLLTEAALTAGAAATAPSAPPEPPLPSYEEIHGNVRSSKTSASAPATATAGTEGRGRLEKCQLCLERQADRSIIPCGHRLCVSCGQILIRAREKCPWDRLVIHSIGY